MNVDLLGSYRKSIRQHQPGGGIIGNNLSLTCMKMINSATGWFEIVEIRTYNLDEVMGGNDEYIDRKTIYENLPPQTISELKPQDSVNVDLLGSYRKSIRQHQPGGGIIGNNLSLTCMKMINSATGWFEIVEIRTYNLDEVMGGNDEYIDN